MYSIYGPIGSAGTKSIIVPFNINLYAGSDHRASVTSAHSNAQTDHSVVVTKHTGASMDMFFVPPERTSAQFNFDLVRMKAHVESDNLQIPDNIHSVEELDAWLMGLDLE
ncbi:hypothetical protein GTU79_19675 [Sodalis ligni]|uniref:hypothetical protein n=1 Tax=Sodalis ligni TaxID=2697027 RepID=UPI00193F7CDF|nr:hypothetical protein [Sodalis ligni]QWA09561.1 hypothetical protein GTU79_19675 [Sodalis ligni]